MAQRETRSTYQTNRAIKTWATYFLLKSLTVPGILKNWTSQKQQVLGYCKMTENSFRARLAEMQQLKLIKLYANRNIKLTSYEDAAGILGITDYLGTIKIEYNEKLPGKQIFQYFLRAEDIRGNQDMQLKALWKKASKQPLLKDALTQMMKQELGSDEKMLAKNLTYFQEELLLLQAKAFKEGSPLLDIIHTVRADINRSGRCIKEHHAYKSEQSVSYMKKVMKEMEIITIYKVCIESEARARIYVPAQNGKPRRDAYKYIQARNITAWFLCDQVGFLYKTVPLKQEQNDTKKIPAPEIKR